MHFSTVYDLFKRTFVRFFSKDTFQMGAALAYYTVFSLAPLVLIAISIASVVFHEKAQERISSEIESTTGSAVAKAVKETIKNAQETGGSTAASIIGIVVLLFGASGVFGQLQDSMNKIWEVQAKTGGGVWGFIRSRLLSFAMVLGIGFLLLVSLIISTALSAMGKYLAPGQTAIAQVLNQLISFGFITLLFALIFKVLPDRPIDWNDVWVGGALTALLFVIGKYLIGLYLAKGSVASAYGAAGSLVVVLVWVYYASQIMMLGAVFTQVYADHNGKVKPAADTGRLSGERSAASADDRVSSARSHAH